MTIDELIPTIKQLNHGDKIQLLQIIVNELTQEIAPPPEIVPQQQRTGFGCMKGTVEIIDDIVSPAVPASEWEVLQ